MPKILFLGDCPPIGPHCTGFGRVAGHIGKALVDAGAEVVQLAINLHDAPEGWQHPYPWQLRPTTERDPLAYHLLAEAMAEPWDAVLGFNDLWVTNLWLRIAQNAAIAAGHEPPPFYGYFPIDAAGLPPTMVRHLPRYAGVATYTDFGAEQLRAAGYSGPCEVIPHGVEPPLPVQRDRRWLPEQFRDSWIAFRADINRPRKRYDLAIRAFCQFAADKPLPPHDRAPLLMLHCGNPGDDLPVADYYQQCAAEFGFSHVDRPLLMTAQGQGHPFADAEQLAQFYRDADCYLQTTDAEGWGLCAVEAAQYECPVILGNHSVHPELWGDAAYDVLPWSWRAHSFTVPDLGKADDGRAMLTAERVALQYPVLTSESYAEGLEQLWQSPGYCRILRIRALDRWANPCYHWPRIEAAIAQWMGLAPAPRKAKPKGFAHA